MIVNPTLAIFLGGCSSQKRILESCFHCIRATYWQPIRNSRYPNNLGYIILEKPSQSSKQFVQIPEEPKSFLKKEQILSNILPNHSNIFIKRSQNRFKNIRPDQSNMKQKHQTCIKKETPNFQTKQIIKSTWFRKFSP